MSRTATAASALTALLLLAAPRPASALDAVVLLESEHAAALEPLERAFEQVVQEADLQTIRWDIQGSRERADAYVERMRRDPPLLVFALGARAAYVMAHELDVPTVYALVRDPARYGIGGPHVTGVGMDVAPAAALAQFQLFAPSVKRLGVLLGSRNRDAEELVRAAAELGFQLELRRVEEPRLVRSLVGPLARHADAIWLLSDPQVLSPDSFHAVREECRRAGIPLFVSTEALVQAGALLAVVPDQRAVGEQAGRLVRELLERGISPGELPVQSPEEVRVVLNLDVLEDLDLEVDPLLLDFADEVVSSSPGR